MNPVLVERGDSPVVLAFPHVGTHVPNDIWTGLNDEGLMLRDTDWQVFELYAGLLPGVTTVRAKFHRYVIDANRDPTGQNLYPGQTTTGLVPLTTFENVPIWRERKVPGTDEVARRLSGFHVPYHAALQSELERVRARNGVAVLFDCHSIRSKIPWLFDGVLPDFNIGTDGGRTCAGAIQDVVTAEAAASGHSHVVNGRFRGGWTTRHYGRPAEGFHAIQMELAQISHLQTEEPPFALCPDKVRQLRPHLARMLESIASQSLSLLSHCEQSTS